MNNAFGKAYGKSRIINDGNAAGDILQCAEGLSFWGGVDPETGRIIDVHHPNHGQLVSGKILMMPTSRGSCSGSGVLLQLSLNALAPAALVFCEHEEILTLGALVSDRIFDRPLPTIVLPKTEYERLARCNSATISQGRLSADDFTLELDRVEPGQLCLTEKDKSVLSGEAGTANKMAMEIICLMAAVNGAVELTDVTKGHIDGCILAHSANLIFAEKLADLGARVSIPTTINAISVDRENWQSQNVPQDFGKRASRLADAYVKMGVRPVFTCAPYLLDDAPELGETIGWSESNAVIFANSVLGARSPKHPDYLDLFIAMTGRAPEAGVYTEAGRVPRTIVEVELPLDNHDDLLWPLLGWLAGRCSPNNIPVLRGLEGTNPATDDLKALCAAFGTTSGAPMLHVVGLTPEAYLPPSPDAERQIIRRSDLVAAWKELNRGDCKIDLVAIGSPHASLSEIRQIVELLAGRRCNTSTQMIITAGRDTLLAATGEGLTEKLAAAGVRLLPDLCWCSITEPIFPRHAKGLMTNSGKYAHYAHGISGRHARLAGIRDCVEAAVTGMAKAQVPGWISDRAAE